MIVVHVMAEDGLNTYYYYYYLNARVRVVCISHVIIISSVIQIFKKKSLYGTAGKKTLNSMKSRQKMFVFVCLFDCVRAFLLVFCANSLLAPFIFSYRE